MSILAIDYGEKKVGLAKSGQDDKMALPYDIIIRKDDDQLLKDLLEVVKREEVEKIVIGVPVSLHANGVSEEFTKKDLENEHMKKVLKFVELVKENIKVEVVTEDERMSTKMANALGRGFIKKGSADDAVAAMLILQSYLDRSKS